MKQPLLLATLLLATCLSAQSDSTLLALAATYPPMPRDAAGTLAVNGPGGGVTFGSGTPYNDLAYTLFDTDYMEGETNGYDLFFPVDPSDDVPGADRVRYLRGVNNLDLDAAYDGAKGDRYILGTPEYGGPFFQRGPDGIDNDYVAIQNFDYTYGHIQLAGDSSDFRLFYATTDEGVQTTGYYLFYTAADQADLIAFIFPCDDLGTTISGNGPQDPTVLCNGDGELRLDDPQQFRFAIPLPITPTLPEAVVQFGTTGKEIVGGIVADDAHNTYTFGSGDGSLDGGPRTGHELFVVKHDPTGSRDWVFELTQPNGALFFDAVVDDNYVYAVGRTLGALPGFTSAGRWDAIIVKLDRTTGILVGSDQFGNSGLDGYGNVVLDDAGHLLLSGQGGPAGVQGTDPDYMLAKYDTTTLTEIWRVFDAPADQPVFVSEAWGGISYLPADQPGEGSLVVAGWYMTLGGANSFVTRYDNLHTAVPTVGATAIIESAGVQADWILDNTVDSLGNIYVGGYTTGNLGGPHRGQGDAFVARFDADLANPTFVQFGTPGSDNLRKLVIDSTGHLYATGYTYGQMNDPADPAVRTDGDFYVAKFNTNMDLLATQQLGTTGEDRAYLAERNGYLYVGGMTEGSLGAPNFGAFDAFVVRLRSNDLSVQTTLPVSTSNPVVEELKVGVRPNPAGEIVYVEMPPGTVVRLLDVAGRTCVVTTASQLNLSAYEPGLYFLQFNSPDGRRAVRKLVKARGE